MRHPYPYKVRNKLNIKMRELQIRRMEETGKRVTLGEIEREVAKYCHLTTDGIKSIKRGLSMPSLPVAMRLSEFFGCKVEDIFQLTPAEKNNDDSSDN